MRTPEHEAAYRASAYRVFVLGRDRFTIRCDEPSDELDRLLDETRTTPWAFLTACNPRSQLLDDDTNDARMVQLEAAVRSHGFDCHCGESEADDGSWPAEPSLLVLGIDEAHALAIAREFEQHAILAGSRGQPARLVWT